jgi:hypothetical protein
MVGLEVEGDAFFAAGDVQVPLFERPRYALRGVDSDDVSAEFCQGAGGGGAGDDDGEVDDLDAARAPDPVAGVKVAGRRGDAGLPSRSGAQPGTCADAVGAAYRPGWPVLAERPT